MVFALLSVLNSGCAGSGGFGRVHYFPNKENPKFYLVMEHFPNSPLRLDKIVEGRIRITLILLPENKTILSELFPVSSVGIIDFEAKTDKHQEFFIQMTDRESSRTWIVEIRKRRGQLSKVRYELIPLAAR